MMTSTEFAKAIGVTVRTLVRWHHEGRFVPAIVLPTGERRYSEEQLESLRGKAPDALNPTVAQARSEERAAYRKWQASPLEKEQEGFKRWKAAHERLLHALMGQRQEAEDLADEDTMVR
jgi:hypothetical protein